MGGTGGSLAEHGGAGTVYLHSLPPDGTTVMVDATHDSSIITHSSNVTATLTNCTLYINNHHRAPMDRDRNMTLGYSDLATASSCAWVIPSPYPSFVSAPVNAGSEEVVVDYIQIYGQGHLAFINNTCLHCNVDVRAVAIEGKQLKSRIS